MDKIFKFDHSIFRLVIRNIEGYGTYPPPSIKTLRIPNLSPSLELLKQQVLDHLIIRQNKRSVKLINWSVAWEVHPSSGLPHLDILLVYDKNFQAVYTTFDYLIKDLKISQRDVGDQVGVGHVWVTPYSSKKLNKAILDYGEKEDPKPLTNLSSQSKEALISSNKFKEDPYNHLQKQMRKDPLHFNLQEYCQKNDLYDKMSNWGSIKSKLKDSQFAAANLLLKNKPGFKYINRSLIESSLSPEELVTFDSWDGYQTIVNYLNQIVTDGNRREMKTKNLLLTGPANIGKTSLFHNPNHRSNRSCIEDYCAVYHMGMSTWFPQYRSYVYHMILWNEAKLTSYSYDIILKFLEGSFVDLPIKGGVAPKRDNPLVIMTSNLTLDQMIKQKFNYSLDLQSMAHQNISKRLQNLIVPPGYNLFLLQKLIVPLV